MSDVDTSTEAMEKLLERAVQVRAKQKLGKELNEHQLATVMRCSLQLEAEGFDRKTLWEAVSLALEENAALAAQRDALRKERDQAVAICTAPGERAAGWLPPYKHKSLVQAWKAEEESWNEQMDALREREKQLVEALQISERLRRTGWGLSEDTRRYSALRKALGIGEQGELRTS